MMILFLLILMMFPHLLLLMFLHLLLLISLHHLLVLNLCLPLTRSLHTLIQLSLLLNLMPRLLHLPLTPGPLGLLLCQVPLMSLVLGALVAPCVSGGKQTTLTGMPKNRDKL